MKRSVWAFIGVAAFIGIVLYIASPFLASRKIQSAALSGEVDILGDHIDTEAVKADMHARLDARLLGPGASPSMADFMSPVLIDRMTSAAASPYGIAELLLGHEPGRPPEGGKPIFTYRDGYVSPNRFRLRTYDPEAKRDGPSFLLKRHRLFQWRIARVDPPADPM